MHIFRLYNLVKHKIYIKFCNLSGICELRISKYRLQTCIKEYDKCVKYVRMKLNDLSITSILNFNMDSDLDNIIIRNIHREKIYRSTTDNYEDYLRTIKCGKCSIFNECDLCNDDISLLLLRNMILFDDKYLMLALFKGDNAFELYHSCSDRLKRDLEICNYIFEQSPCSFSDDLPIDLQNNKEFILSLSDEVICEIYEYISDDLKNDLQIHVYDM